MPLFFYPLMPKLSKLEFATLVRSMPGASEEEIFAAAEQKEAESYEQSPEQAPAAPEQSMLGQAWDFVRTPLTDAPSRYLGDLAEKLDRPSADGRPVHPLASFGAGAVKGVGDLASQMTSPLDLALSLVGFGGHAAGARGALGISKAARNLETGLMAPIIAEGGVNAATGIAEGDATKAGMGVLQAAGGGIGAKVARQHSFPTGKVRDAYMQSQGRPTARPELTTVLDEDLATQTANAYEAMKHTPNDPQVKASYEALVDEVERQYDFVTKQAGVKVEPYNVKGDEANYANADAMRKDIAENNRLTYYPSDDGFGLNAPEELVHPMMGRGKNGMRVNDMFRVIHDYFGHGVDKGNSFQRLGERRAFEEHSSMMPEEAKGAMATETHGQNSWVHAGPHVQRNADGSLPQPGQDTYAPRYADQKAGILPEEFQSAAPSASAPTAASRGIGTEAPSPSPQAYGLDDAAVKVGELTATKGGASFNLHKGDLAGSDHYAVSVFPERGEILDGPVSPEQLRDFIGKNADLLEDPTNSIGTWHNQEDGKTYLDISVTVPSLDDALRLGREKGQIAIFDLKNFDEIKVPQSGVTAAAPAVTRAAGDVGPEFHAVEASSGAPAKGAPFTEPEGGVPMGKAQADAEKARVDAVRREAAMERGEKPLPRGGGSTTALSVASGAVVPLIGEGNVLDFGDEDTNNMVRAGLGGLGLLGVGKVLAKTPKPLGVAKTAKGFQAYHPVTGRQVKIGLGETADNLRKPLVTEGIEPKWEGEFAKVGLKNGSAPPAKSFDELVSVTKKGQLRFNKEVEARLRTLYRYGQEKFAAEDGAEWLKNGILDDMLKFLPVEKPATASHRLFGSLSPATDVIGNMIDMMRVGLRTKKHHERGTLELTPEFAKDKLMTGVGNKPSKAPNVVRSLKGEPLQSYGKPDPFSEGKVDDLARGMAGEPDAIPFDMWWARALGLPNDAQPLNGFSYKLLFEAGAEIARKNGEDPFPFMAKVWAAMKHLHGGGGGVAPNKLARDMGLGQVDLFDKSTLPSGKAGQKMLKQVQQGGSELLGGLGVNERADATLRQADDARHLLKVAEDTGFKGLRTGRFNKMENAIKKQAYKKFVTDRAEGVSFKQGQADAAEWTSQQLAKLRNKMGDSKDALREHLTAKLAEGELPIDVDSKILMQRVEEILNPASADAARYRQATSKSVPSKTKGKGPSQLNFSDLNLDTLVSFAKPFGGR